MKRADYPDEQALRVIADRRCRYVLEYLHEIEAESVTVDDIARFVREREGASTQATETDVRISLYHSKLPQLAAAEVVEFDHETDTVRYAADPELESVLAVISSIGEKG